MSTAFISRYANPMPKIAANVSLLFPQLPFPERFAAAAKAGCRYVEYQFPYPFGSAQEIAECARSAGVEVVLHNLPGGDAAKGDRGIACHPGRAGEFREGVDRAIEYAKAAGCPRLNVLAGICSQDLDKEKAKQTLIENLRYAAGKCKAAGLMLLTEPCNPRTIPGFFLNSSKQAIEVIDAAAQATYASLVQATIKASGARNFFTAGGKVTAFVGEAPKVVAISEWDSLEQYQAFRNGSAYKDLAPQRDKALKIRTYAVEAAN
jgi:uncharacterized protein (DUF1330 family)